MRKENNNTENKTGLARKKRGKMIFGLTFSIILGLIGSGVYGYYLHPKEKTSQESPKMKVTNTVIDKTVHNDLPTLTKEDIEKLNTLQKEFKEKAKTFKDDPGFQGSTNRFFRGATEGEDSYSPFLHYLWETHRIVNKRVFPKKFKWTTDYLNDELKIPKEQTN